MRIRTATGRADPRPSDTDDDRAADDGGSVEFRTALDPPTGGRRHHGASSTAQVDDGQERSGRPARSRRWVQLRDVTARASDARDTDAAKSGHGSTRGDGTKPTSSRRTAAAPRAGKRKDLHRETRPKPVETEQEPVEAGQEPTNPQQKPTDADKKPTNPQQKPTDADESRTEVDKRLAEADQGPAAAGRARDTIPCVDPLAALWDLALLPPRMTIAATTEALKMFTPSGDDTRDS